jgi:hypothetical protein
LFLDYHPNAKVLPVAAPGGAALLLADKLGLYDDTEMRDIDFARLFHTHLNFLADGHQPTNSNRRMKL